MARVLIVDDDSAVRQLLCAILTREGHDFEQARDGAEALQLLATRRYDAILLDLMMGAHSGGNVLTALAAAEPMRRNVIVLTATNDRQIAAVDTKAVHAVLRKPFDLAELVAALREVIRPPHLLHVEDDVAAQYLVRKNLEAAGFAVTTSGDGRAALRTLSTSTFDAVIVDLKLPIISGYDVIDHVISRPDPPPVIVLTVAETPDRPLPGIAAYLQKPEGYDEIVAALRSARVCS